MFHSMGFANLKLYGLFLPSPHGMHFKIDAKLNIILLLLLIVWLEIFM